MATYPDLTVISIHSRKGGVGKTSIAMSIALQVALDCVTKSTDENSNSKVAYLEMDTQGSYLSQTFPLDRDFWLDNDQLHFQKLAGTGGGKTFPHPYHQRPSLSSVMKAYLDRLKTSPSPKNSPSLVDAETHLLIPDHLLDKIRWTQSLSLEHFKRSCESVGLFLASGFVSEADAINSSLLTTAGQALYVRFLNKSIDDLYKKGYRYIILDNIPGLSYNSGADMIWLLDAANRFAGVTQPIFVCSPTQYDFGLIAYETNIYIKLYKETNPIFVFNRRGNSEHLPASLLPGSRFVLSDISKSDPLYDNIISRLLCLPMWLSASNVTNAEIAGSKPENWTDLSYILPLTSSVVTLGNDISVYNSFVRSEDRYEREQSVMSEPDKSFNDAEQDMIVGMERVIQMFVLRALQGSSAASGFHHHVYQTLVKPLLKV